jgi:hypothetical protein
MVELGKNRIENRIEKVKKNRIEKVKKNQIEKVKKNQIEKVKKQLKLKKRLKKARISIDRFLMSCLFLCVSNLII